MTKIEIEFKEVVTTLFKGHYHYGVAALINSLAKSGFRGLINVGYRGDLPPWVNQLKSKESNYFYLSEDILISFVLLSTELHFSYYKPFFLKETFERFKEIGKI